MDYLMHGVFASVAFFLGALITHLFKSKKINALKLEAQGEQSKFYELQILRKKQISEKDEIIDRLRKESVSMNDGQPLLQESSADDIEKIQSLIDDNSALKQELMSIKAKAKELKVEKAIKKVEKNYPMQLYGMDGEESKPKEKSKIKKKKQSTKSSKLKKSKAKIVSSDDETIPQLDNSKKSSKLKSKKTKKKSKSKKRNSKKVLALDKRGKKTKKNKSTKKKKKK